MAERVVPGVGDTFGGYTIEAPLGRGGMGSVYIATHERLARKVALKLIVPELAHDDDFRLRFLRESRMAASLDHPNVIPIYDADEVNGVLFIAMRYVDSPSLQALLRERGSFSPEETSQIATQIGAALDAAHAAQLVHRDVKPANILIGADRHAYLCDFGLAKHAGSHGMTRTGTFVGTVDYVAPEQIEGRTVDGRADVYSLGCVLFHCLAGSPPYRRDNELAALHAHLQEPPPALSRVRPGLPPSLDGVLATAMAKDPDARYQTAGALASAFADAVAGKAPATRAAPTVAAAPAPSEAPTVAKRRPRRTRLLAAALAVALVAIAAAVVVLATRGSDDGTQAAKLRTFVDRIENVLEQSAQGRREIGAALTAGFACTIAPREAGDRIASVADNRQSILLQLGTLPAPTPEADTAVTLLQRALQESIEADRHYRDGFRALGQSGCPLPPNANFDLARKSDARATAAKRRFVDAFDPLAERFGGRTWTAGGF